MAVNNPEKFQGGSAVRLDNFYNSILGGFQRSQQQLAVQQQNEAKRLESEQKELADMMSKVNTAGVQRIDIPDMTEKLNGLYEKYYKANKAESKAEKLLLRAELQQDIEGLAQFVGQSKLRGTEQLKLSEFVGSPTNMGLVSSDALNRLKNYSNIPTAKLPVNAFNRQDYLSPDTSYVSKTAETLLSDLMKDAPVTREFGKAVNVVGKRGVEQFEKQTLAKEVFAEALGDRYKNDVKFKNTLDYASAQSGQTPQQVMLDMVQSANLSKSKQLANEYAYKPTQERSGGDGDSTEGFVIESDYDVNYGNGSTVTAREYMSIPTTPTISAGKFKMQDANGNPYQGGNTTEEIKLVSIGTFPVLTKDRKTNTGKVIPKGALATKSFAEKNPNAVTQSKKAIVNVKNSRGTVTTYFAEPNEVISRTKLTKAQKQALGNFESTYNSRTTTKAPAPKKDAVKKGILD